MESGKWKVESEKWKVKSGKWKVESEKWKVKSGKWKVEFEYTLRNCQEISCAIQGSMKLKVIDEQFLI